MTLMHLVTGQYQKREMVWGTMKLVEILYDATNLDIKGSS